MAFWTYMLRCADGRLYLGHTDALEQRIAQHRQGRGCDYTARRRPVVFVWSEQFPTRAEALAAERQIKGWSRAKKEALIRGDWERVSWLAVPPGARPSTSLRTDGDGALGCDGKGALDCEGEGERATSNRSSVRPELVEGRASDARPALPERAA